MKIEAVLSRGRNLLDSILSFTGKDEKEDMNLLFARFALASAVAAALVSVAAAQDSSTTTNTTTSGTATSTTTTTTTTTTTNAPKSPSPDSGDADRLPSIGPEFGIFAPTNAHARAAFGDTWFDYGLALKPIDTYSNRGRLGFDLNFISTAGSGRYALLIPVGLSYKRSLTDSISGITPYIGATGGLLFADLRSDNYNVHSGFRGGISGSALIGINFQRTAFVEARYDVFTKIKGFDLSGLNLETGLRF